MMNRFIVCGAPCAGKSTFVAENAPRGDLVYDYDTLQMALSQCGSHDHLQAIRPYVIAAREAIFEQLEAHPSQGAWIISSSPRKAEIHALAERLGAEIEFLEVSREEAHARADLDSRPAEWHDYIENWFEIADLGSDMSGSKSRRSDQMKQKTFSAPFQIKEDGDPGEVIAVFATLNVKDHDSDVTIPGAFSEQEVIIEPWNHGWTLPAGKGVIESDEKEAWIDGRFFLDTEVGRENYQTVKNLGPLAEWSYSFNILENGEGEFDGRHVRFLRKLDVVGVGPVTRGAGINTRTEMIKHREQPLGEDEVSDEDIAGKSSTANLLTRIAVSEIEMIVGGKS